MEADPELYPAVSTTTAASASAVGVGVVPPVDAQRSETPRVPRACAECARQKMKCTWPATTDRAVGARVCARCARMRLACHIPTLRPRKKRGKATGSKVSQIEQKLDGIVSLLRSGNAQPQAQQQASPAPPSHPSQEAARRQPLTPDSSSATHHVPPPSSLAEPALPPSCGPLLTITTTSDGTAKAPQTSTAAARRDDFLLVPGFALSPGQAQAYLDVYRQDYAPSFPFVLLDDGVTAAGLRARSACLFWSVMAAVVPQTCDVQIAVRGKLRELVSRHCVVLQERSLELLQSILLYLVWCEFHFFIDSHATPLIQLASSLVTDLKLDGDPLGRRHAPRTLLGDAWLAFGHATGPAPGHSAAEKRALLGYYHVASLVKTLFDRGPQPAWSAYHASCCDSLAEDSCPDTDRLLVGMIRAQRVVDRFEAAREEDAEHRGVSEHAGGCVMWMRSAQADLRSVRASLPAKVANNSIYSSLHHLLTMRLLSPSLDLASAPEHTTSSNPTRTSRYLTSLLGASTSFFQTLSAIPPSTLTLLPSTNLALLSAALDISSRLLLLPPSVPGWHPPTAREQLDLPRVVRRLARGYEEADALALEGGRKVRVLDAAPGAFVRQSAKLRWLAQWFERRLREESSDSDKEEGHDGETVDVYEEGGVNDDDGGDGVDGVMDWEAVLSDEKLWQEFMDGAVAEGMLLDVPDFEHVSVSGMN